MMQPDADGTAEQTDRLEYVDLTTRHVIVLTNSNNANWYTGWPKKTSRNLRNYNGAYTSWGEISSGTFVDQYMYYYLLINFSDVINDVTECRIMT